MNKKKLYSELIKLAKEANTDSLEIGSWDGGNDSGWAQCSLKDPQLAEHLEELFADTLGYGSYAGCFETSGTINFDVKNKEIVFEGDEYSSENRDTIYTETLDLKKYISEDVYKHSDSLNVYAFSAHGDIESTRINVNIKNGIKPESFKQVEQEITDAIDKFINEHTDKYEHYFCVDQVIPMSDVANNTAQIDLDVEVDSHEPINKTIELG